MSSYVIVGASRGLGYEWLRQLSNEASNNVFGLVRTVERVEAKLIADNIKNVTILQADMSDHQALAAAAEQVGKITAGSLDYLIVNGVFFDPATMKMTPRGFTGKEEVLRKDMTASLNVNVIGLMYSINAFLPLLQKGSVKKIVVMSSGHADPEFILKSEVADFVTYTTMKAALNIIVAKYAVDLKSDGITVLALSPGIVNTAETLPSEEEMQVFQQIMQKIKKTYPHFNGPMSPAESVVMQRRVIDNITIADSGAFWSHLGNKQWL